MVGRLIHVSRGGGLSGALGTMSGVLEVYISMFLTLRGGEAKRMCSLTSHSRAYRGNGMEGGQEVTSQGWESA